MFAIRIALVALLASACTNSAGAGSVSPPPGSPNASEVTDTTAFWLPVNSERFGVSGRVANVCVGLVWDFSNLDEPRTMHCDDFTEGFPYAVVVNKTGECGEVWDYRRNAVMKSASGCIDPVFEGDGSHTVDVVATISSGLFAGEIHIAVP